MKQAAMNQTQVKTPMGWLLLTANETHLTGLEFDSRKRDLPSCRNPILKKARKQVEEYFAGKRRDFDLPLEQPGTPFQKKVWDTLCRIPYGKVVSYQELASRMGKPGSQRAVGNALGKNAIPVIVPCHRVVAANGIGGFTSGLHRKRRLFSVENITLD